MAPASVANVACGYDIMGFALENLGDRVTIALNPDTLKDTMIVNEGKYGSFIPVERKKNTATVAVDAYLKAIGRENLSYSIWLEKNLPLGSGLGSSASSAVAAVYGMNYLLGNPLAAKELIPFAMEGERVACGAAHADNVAPSLLGGFTLIRSYSPLDIIEIPSPQNLYAVVAHPEIELKTSDARRILKKEIDLKDAVKQSANTAGFITGLLTNNFSLIGRSMEDVLAEPQRMQLIPGFEEVKKEVMKSGAIGFGISGSGPSVFAFCEGGELAGKIKQKIKNSFEGMGLHCDVFISGLNASGAKVIENEIL